MWSCARDLWRYLQELNRDGKTILLTSHYLEEVERLCRTIAIVNDGRIVRHGPKDEFFDRDRRAGSGLSRARPASASRTMRRGGTSKPDGASTGSAFGR